MKIINIDLAQNNKKNVPLIILNGSGGVGKDSFVNACANYVSLENYSTITYYKEIAKEIPLSRLKMIDDYYDSFKR